MYNREKEIFYIYSHRTRTDLQWDWRGATAFPNRAGWKRLFEFNARVVRSPRGYTIYRVYIYIQVWIESYPRWIGPMRRTWIYTQLRGNRTRVNCVWFRIGWRVDDDDDAAGGPLTCRQFILDCLIFFKWNKNINKNQYLIKIYPIRLMNFFTKKKKNCHYNLYINYCIKNNNKGVTST